MTKIKRLTIKGLRAVRQTISLDLDAKSMLLYGDNGTVKSSISDALECFYTNKISHLSIEEINLNEALRNSFIGEDDSSAVHLKFNTKGIDNEKSLSNQKGKWKTTFTNTNPDGDGYISESHRENLILRYRECP